VSCNKSISGHIMSLWTIISSKIC